MDTGRKILNLRKDRAIPQKHLAVLTSVTPSALSRIESGKHQPKGPIAFGLARLLGVTADYLLDDTASYPPPQREILENLESRRSTEPRDLQVAVSEQERKILEQLRDINEERFTLLKGILEAPRTQVRFAAFLLGMAEALPGIEPDELEQLKAKLNSVE